MAAFPRLLSFFAVLALLAGMLFAQGTDRGTLIGTITDTSGAIVPAASVKIANLATGIEQSTLTDATGNYAVPNLLVGNYRISAEAHGFKTAVVQDVRIQVGATFRADITLEVGEVSNQVTVEAATPLLKTDSADVSHVVEQKRIVDLPLNGRDFQQLQLLTPGSVSTTNLQTSSGLGGGASAVSTTGTLNVSNGSRPGSQLYLLDGSYASNRQGRTIIVTPSVDEIEEFRVAGSNFSAEYGYGTNVINVSTKSGTNRLHGAAWEFLRNDSLAARSFFSPTVGVLRRNQFGGSMGGPVIKDRSFFFFTYEGQRQTTTSTLLATVPTEAMRGGNLSELPFPIFDPRSSRLNANGVVVRDPFSGNIIPAGRIDPVSTLFLQWVPLPNRPGVVANFINTPTLSNDYNHYSFRFDHKLTAKDSLMGRWTHRSNQYPLAISAYDKFSKDNYSPGTVFSDVYGTNFVFSWTHLFSPRTILEVRPSYGSPSFSYLSPNFGTDWTTKAGIQGFGHGVSDVFPTFPSLSYSGFSGLPNNDGFADRHHTRDIAGAVTLVRGVHLIKAGNSFASFQEGIYPYGQGEGSFSYTGAFTSNPAQAGASGSGLGDYLLGLPFSGGRYVPPGKYYMQLRNVWNYVQDDWKVNSRLTLNLGLRYELNFPTTEKYNQLATFIPSARGGKGAIVVPDAESVSQKNFALHSSLGLSLSTYQPLIVYAGDAGLPSRSMRFTDHKQFAPRFGMALRVKKDMTVRAGYGIYYNQLDGNRETEFLSPPFLIRESGVLNVIDQNGAPTRTTQTLFPNESKFSAQPVLLGHDPYVHGYGYTQQWNLTVQKLLPGSFSLEAAYVGAKGTHLQTSRNLNAPMPGQGPIQPRRPYPDFLGITWNEQSASSIYHAFQAKLERRFAKGFTLLSSFTWSKAIDNSSESAQGCVNPYNCRADRGLSSFDVPLSLVVSAVYEIPAFRNSSVRLLKHTLGGWELAAIATAQGGFPFSAGWSGDTANTGQSTRPNRICSGKLDHPTINQWFDTTCFVSPAQFTYGNSGRNILRGPNMRGADLGLYKNFIFAERHRIQFRAEFFNAFNHPIFGLPSTTVNVAGAGRILSASPGRIVQFGFKYAF